MGTFGGRGEVNRVRYDLGQAGAAGGHLRAGLEKGQKVIREIWKFQNGIVELEIQAFIPANWGIFLGERNDGS